MRTRTQNKITGTTGEAGFHQGQQERTHDELQFFDSDTVKVEHTTRGVRLHAKAPPPPAENERMHPFKIYQNFSVFPNDGAAWRTVRVRGGYLVIDYMPGVFVDESKFTDGVNRPYDDDRLTIRADGSAIDQSTVTNIVCASGVKTFFWLEFSSTPKEATVKWGTDPTANGWTAWPDADSSHLVIGWVDTATREADKFAFRYNVLTYDVLQACIS